MIQCGGKWCSLAELTEVRDFVKLIGISQNKINDVETFQVILATYFAPTSHFRVPMVRVVEV